MALAFTPLLTRVTFLRWLYHYWCCVSDYQPRSAMSVTLSSVNVNITLRKVIQQLTLVVLKARWPAIFQVQKCIHFWLASLILVIWQYMHLSMQTTLAICTTSSPPPPTHDSLSLHDLHIQGCHLHSICKLSYLLLSLLLINSNEKVTEVSSALSGLSCTNSNCSQAHRSTGCILIVAISKPCSEAWSLQKPGSCSSQLKLSVS